MDMGCKYSLYMYLLYKDLREPGLYFEPPTSCFTMLVVVCSRNSFTTGLSIPAANPQHHARFPVLFGLFGCGLLLLERYEPKLGRPSCARTGNDPGIDVSRVCAGIQTYSCIYISMCTST